MINGVPARLQPLILAAYRFAFATNLVVYMLATAIYVWRLKKINYEYIYGITRQGSVTPWAIYQLGMWMSITWMTCWIWQINYQYRVNYQLIVMTIMWILFAFVPLARLRSSRKVLSGVVLNTIIAPFGPVDFLHTTWGSVQT